MWRRWRGGFARSAVPPKLEPTQHHAPGVLGVIDANVQVGARRRDGPRHGVGVPEQVTRTRCEAMPQDEGEGPSQLQLEPWGLSVELDGRTRAIQHRERGGCALSATRCGGDARPDERAEAEGAVGVERTVPIVLLKAVLVRVPPQAVQRLRELTPLRH